MNYTLNTVQSAFLSVVKVKRDYDPTYKNKLDSDLVGTSDSGLYFNTGVSSLVNIKNICSLNELVSDWSIPTYDSGTEYNKDEIVVSNSNYYISLVDENKGNDLSGSSWDGPTTLESILFKRDVYNVIEQVLAITVPTQPLLDHALLYTISDLSDTITGTSKYVGFEIRPHGSEHLKLILNRIGAQFTEANSDVTLYLYKNNTEQATGTFDNTANEFTWTDITGFSMSGSARWFVFYDQDNVNGKACNWNFYIGVDEVSAFAEFLPFEVANTTTNFLQEVDGYTNNSYGLGFDLSVIGNLDQFLIKNKVMFAECIQLQFIYNFFDKALNNPNVRSNQEQRLFLQDEQSINIMLGELKSDSENSIVSRLKRAYGKLKKSLKFGDAVLTCDDEDNYLTITNFG